MEFVPRIVSKVYAAKLRYVCNPVCDFRKISINIVKLQIRDRPMPKVMSVEELFQQNRNISIYFEMWENSHSKRDPLITKWIDHIEKNTEKTGLCSTSEKK